MPSFYTNIKINRITIYQHSKTRLNLFSLYRLAKGNLLLTAGISDNTVLRSITIIR